MSTLLPEFVDGAVKILVPLIASPLVVVVDEPFKTQQFEVNELMVEPSKFSLNWPLEIATDKIAVKESKNCFIVFSLGLRLILSFNLRILLN
jgi:hypothetical protein